MIWLVGLILVLCAAYSFGIAQALHLGFFAATGLSFVITTIVLNVTGVMHRF